MFLCPLCRQVANLAANVQEDEGGEEEEEVEAGVSAEGVSEIVQVPLPASAGGPVEPRPAVPDSGSDSEDREQRTNFQGANSDPEPLPEPVHDAGQSTELSALASIDVTDSVPQIQRGDTATNQLSSPETDGEDMMEVEEEDGAASEDADAEESERKVVVREDEGEGGGGGPMEV
jgi:hypothetical protein